MKLPRQKLPKQRLQNQKSQAEIPGRCFQNRALPKLRRRERRARRRQPAGSKGRQANVAYRRHKARSPVKASPISANATKALRPGLMPAARPSNRPPRPKRRPTMGSGYARPARIGRAEEVRGRRLLQITPRPARTGRRLASPRPRRDAGYLHDIDTEARLYRRLAYRLRRWEMAKE